MMMMRMMMMMIIIIMMFSHFNVPKGSALTALGGASMWSASVQLFQRARGDCSCSARWYLHAVSFCSAISTCLKGCGNGDT
eukprot:564833-Karenia_brevis.AAC.1